jgi:quinol monooxygenase YgiN
MALRLTGELRCASPDEVAAIRRHRAEHVRLTRAEPGCIAFEIAETDDPLIWRVEERFRDRAAFEAHQRRTRASPWWEATQTIARDFEMSETD